jgi:type I restriction enzyme S subunit
MIGRALDDVDHQIVALERLVSKKEAIKQGMMQQLLTAKLRLPGYVGSWRRLKLQELLIPRSERNTGREQLDVLSCTKHRGFVKSLDYFKSQVYSRDLSNYLVIHRGDIGYPANHIEEGSIGVQDLMDKGLVSPIYVVMQAHEGIDSYFLQRQLKLDSFRQEFAKATNASVNRRGGLRWSEFSKIYVSIPEHDEQRAISRVLRAMDESISTLQRRLAKAKAIKQGVMQGLLTGRTRLPLVKEVVV